MKHLARTLFAALFVAALLPACGSPPVDPDPGLAGPVPGDFSGSHAWADLEALAEVPRPLGSDGAEAARSHIAAKLAASGIAVERVGTTSEGSGFGPLALTHLVSTLPGSSPDRIVLIAPYGSGQYDGFAFVGANDGASGAALLLEIARVLAGRALPYTVELVWIEGEGRLGHGAPEERELRWLGSRGLAARWAETGHLDGIRLLVAFNRVCDADLRIARDLSSHREHREAFWKAARRLGQTDAFQPNRGYESVSSSHVAFRELGVRPVVAIEDTVFGGDEAPGLYADTEGDIPAHCAPASLEAVGTVAIEAVEAVAARLAKIDRFARTPSVQPEPTPPAAANEPPPAVVEPKPAAGAASSENPENPDAAGAL